MTLTPRAPLRILVLVLLAGGAAPAFATPAAPAGDSTEALAWARRVVGLRRHVVEAREASAARRPSAPALAERAFVEARGLAGEPGMLDDEGFRTLFLQAQAEYERFHGGVAGIPMRGGEVGELRDDAFDALASGARLPEPASALAAPVASLPAVRSALAYPADAARSIATQASRLRGMIGDPAGLERRGRGYFRLIDRELERRGLPRELRYVPVIESGLNPRAVSSAGAAGLWQLMPATGAQFGLDAAGRHDPARSTVAACRLLERLGEMFDGDWQLALAAYNWGPARVQSLVARERRRLGRAPTYWDVSRHMPAETRAYVPRFIAVAEAMGG